MIESPEPDLIQTVLPHLGPDERVAVTLRATEAVVAITNKRLVVTVNERLALALAFQGLRRIQLDIERERPTTLVILPEDPRQEAQVLSIPGSEIERVAHAVAVVGRQFTGPPER